MQKMQTNAKWFRLQRFAEGGEGAEGGAESGASAEDAARAKLRELGVPEGKLRKNRSYAPRAVSGAQSAGAGQEQVQDDDAPQAQETQEQGTQEPEKPKEPKKQEGKKPSFDELMQDPEYNSAMQDIIRGRLKKERSAQDTLDKLGNALMILQRGYGLDPEKGDYALLAQKIEADDRLYEDRANEMGTNVETARKLDSLEYKQRITEREREASTREQMIAAHFQGLEQQGEELRKTFPSFDLRTELKNPVFARMTAPGGGVSVADAYYAVHREELMAASMQAAAQKTAQKLSNAIQAGKNRPVENGAARQAGAITTFDYAHASKQQREELKARIRAAAARGEKLYPGQ